MNRSRTKYLVIKKEYNGAYVYADEHDCLAGFFVYTVNRQDKSGFVRFIVMDNTPTEFPYRGEVWKRYMMEHKADAVKRMKINYEYQICKT